MLFLIPLVLYYLFQTCQADNFLEPPECPGPAPENGWPPGGISTHKVYYLTLNQLCVHDRLREDGLRDLGCVCSADGNVNCFLQDRAPLLALYCISHCQCSVTPRRSFRDRITQSFRNRPVDHPSLARSKTDKVMPNVFDGQVKKTSWCGFGCTSFTDCAEYEVVPGCDRLACEVNMLSAGSYFGIGTCSLLGRKRDNSMVCSCNSTYVSQSCCASRNGLVWEDPESKLGVIDSTL